MGSKTFDGVWFIAYSDDHLPEHIHGFYAETEVILELVFAERKIRLARKAKPLNAKKSDVKRIVRVANRFTGELIKLWEDAQP